MKALEAAAWTALAALALLVYATWPVALIVGIGALATWAEAQL